MNTPRHYTPQVRQIGYAQVEIRPELMVRTDHIAYSIHSVVIVNGEKFHTQYILPDDDIEPRFDVIWRHMGNETKRLIMEMFPPREPVGEEG